MVGPFSLMQEKPSLRAKQENSPLDRESFNILTSSIRGLVHAVS